jgi:peptidoglycan/LPS O-acetylase OafA/YrhL
MVVMYHANLAGNHFLHGEGRYDFLNYGYLRIDFFFVLSGFIIYHTTSHQSGKRRTLNTFLALRMARIFAPYLPLAIAFGLLYTFPIVASEANREWSWVPTLTLIPWGLPPALSVAWTLQHELAFYLIFGLLFFSGFLWLGLFLWLVTILWFSMLANQALPEPFATALAPINIEFIFGLLAAAFARDIGKRLELALLWAGAAVGAWIALGAVRELSVFVGAAIALLIPSLVRAETNGGFSTPSTLVLLGDASYSIYLIHPLAIAVSARLLRDAWIPVSVEIGLVVMVLGSIGAGLLYYLLFERHAHSFLRNWILARATSEKDSSEVRTVNSLSVASQSLAKAERGET